VGGTVEFDVWEDQALEVPDATEVHAAQGVHQDVQLDVPVLGGSCLGLQCEVLGDVAFQDAGQAAV